MCSFCFFNDCRLLFVDCCVLDVCWLLVVVLVVGWLLFVLYFWSLAIVYRIIARRVYCFLFIVCCLLVIVCVWLAVVCYLAAIDCCFVVRYLLVGILFFVAHCLLIVVCL